MQKIQAKAKIAITRGKDALKNNDGLQVLWPGLVILLFLLGGVLLCFLKLGT